MNPKKTQPHITIDVSKCKHRCHNKHPNKKTLKAMQDVDNGIGLEEIEDMRTFIEKILTAAKDS